MVHMVPVAMPMVHAVQKQEQEMVHMVLVAMSMVHVVQERVMVLMVPMVMPTVHEVQEQVSVMVMVRCILEGLLAKHLAFVLKVLLVWLELALMGWARFYEGWVCPSAPMVLEWASAQKVLEWASTQMVLE
jgi:hypothetical protein